MSTNHHHDHSHEDFDHPKRLIRFNRGFALALEVVFRILAVLGRAGLRLAVPAETGATPLVIAHALRLLRLLRVPAPRG
jgi:cation transport ATPase